MYIVVSGKICIIKSHILYEKFAENEKKMKADIAQRLDLMKKSDQMKLSNTSYLQQEKDKTRKTKYGLLEFILKLPKVQEKLREVKLRKYMTKHMLDFDENFEVEILESGGTFGNFYTLTAKKYRPIYAICLEDETRVVEINS